MKKTLFTTAAAGAIIATGLATSAMAEGHATELTLCWAAWDPANSLIELSKDFEAQSGHTMNFEFVPWTSFADRMLNERTAIDAIFTRDYPTVQGIVLFLAFFFVFVNLLVDISYTFLNPQIRLGGNK